MNEFEQEIQKSIHKQILDNIQDVRFLQYNHGTAKTVPEKVVQAVWDSVDWEEIINTVKPEIERRICNSLIASIETEIKTDVKKLLSISSVREELRMKVYPKLIAVLNKED